MTAELTHRPPLERSERLYNLGSHADGDERRCWAGLSALAATEAIQAGEREGHFRRALARLMFSRPTESLDAVRDLLAYLAQYHGDAPNPHARALSDAEGLALEQLTRVTVDTDLADVTISARRVDGLPSEIVSTVNGRTHYAAPGELEFSVTAPGYALRTRRLQLHEGPQTLIVDDSDSVESPVNDPRHITLRRLEPPSASSTPTTPLSLASRPFRPWILPTALSAGVFAALGVAFSIWYATDRAPYDQLCVDSGHGAADCRARFDDLNTAEGLTITSFALAGALTAGALTLWFLDRSASVPSVATRGCTFNVPGAVHCLF